MRRRTSELCNRARLTAITGGAEGCVVQRRMVRIALLPLLIGCAGAHDLDGVIGDDLSQ